MPAYLNNGSSNPPQLAVYLNTDNLADPPEGLNWPEYPGLSGIHKLQADGFEGLQITHEDPAPHSPLPYCGLDRINKPEEADAILHLHQSRGDQCISVHAGWGMESDREIDLLVEAVLTASAKRQFPVFLETHRSTITQDMWRTVEITKRFPEIRFNADFSHYYCGQEMPYGTIREKFDFMQPIFDRVGFMHGRIASPGHIQAPINETLDGPPDFSTCPFNYVEHFREMWIRSMRGFKTHAGPGDVLIFAPELLSPTFDYARCDKHGNEECDRYAQALLYMKWARICYDQA
ncbi:hypothetical protein P0Y35_01110 [Kiritimatiellaeota bacterium B1221]|nr:hypothetical protein [Kiritimatiellaeota bacterium B1221]